MSLKVYKASAGSGKTFQLALEFIALALQSGAPNAFTKILAVTFTNKATAEMKDRILIQLYNLAKGGRDKGFMQELLKRLKLPQDEIEMRAARTLNAIVHNYDRFRVETIDSFFQSMLTNLARELKLSRTFRVDLDADEVISQAVDRLLLSIKDENSTESYIANLVLSYMKERIEEAEGWNISRELKQFAKKNLFGDEYLRNEADLENYFSNSSNLSGLKTELIKREQQLNAAVVPLALQLVNLLRAGNLPDPSKLNAYKALVAFADKLVDGDYGVALDSKKAEDFKCEPSSLLTKALKDDAAYLQLAEQVSSLLCQIDSQRTPANVLFMQTSYLTKMKLIHLCLLSWIGVEVTRICAENNTFMLAKTPDLFNKVVGKDDSSFVFERVGNTFQHVLIDEFQDTSHIQWENFKRLLIENLAKGDDCMLVGDVKQSIYRWRGGDWKILGYVEKELEQIGKVEQKSLDQNFRSKQVIVDFNNQFFDVAVKKLDQLNIESGFDTTNLVGTMYDGVCQTPIDQSGEGYVRISLMPKAKTDDDLLDDLYEQIRIIHEENQVPYDKMAILVRYNSESQDIIDYFAENHPEVPFTSDEAFKLSASPAVMLLVSTLQFLDDTDNTVAFALCKQYAHAITDKCGIDIFTSLSERSLLEHSIEWSRMPLYELCHQLISFYRLSECEEKGAGQSAYLFYFLDLVLDYLDTKPSDIQAFLQYWDEKLVEKSINVDIQDSIYIMTIHKAKGLERHTVFIPFCNWQLDKDYGSDIIWCDTCGLPDPFSQIPLVPVSAMQSTKVKSSYFMADYNDEHLLQRIDSLNSLYVAFTRARNNLLVWSKPGRLNNTVNLLISHFINGEKPAVKPKAKTKTKVEEVTIKEFGSLLPYVKPAAVVDDNPLVTDNAGRIDVSFCEHPFCVEFKQSNRANDFLRNLNENMSDEEKAALNARFAFIDRGKVMHYLLSKIYKYVDLPSALLRIKCEGLITEQREIDSIQRLLEKRLSDERVARWFDGTWQVFNECSIFERDVAGVLHEQRPDRVMRKGNELVVLDYKFGTFKDEYIKQVQGYMHTLTRMGHRSISGFLWFVYTGELCPVTI